MQWTQCKERSSHLTMLRERNYKKKHVQLIIISWKPFDQNPNIINQPTLNERLSFLTNLEGKIIKKKFWNLPSSSNWLMLLNQAMWQSHLMGLPPNKNWGLSAWGWLSRSDNRNAFLSMASIWLTVRSTFFNLAFLKNV